MVSELVTKKELHGKETILSPPAMAKMALSPTSVVQEGETEAVEPMFLTSASIVTNHAAPDAALEWSTLTASAKSQRTKNPIREIVDPIVASIQSGLERNDNKELISLAVSRGCFLSIKFKFTFCITQ